MGSVGVLVTGCSTTDDFTSAAAEVRVSEFPAVVVVAEVGRMPESFSVPVELTVFVEVIIGVVSLTVFRVTSGFCTEVFTIVGTTFSTRDDSELGWDWCCGGGCGGGTGRILFCC